MELATGLIAVKMDTVLFQTDAPDLVLSRDIFGAAYLCSLIEIDSAGQHYLAVQISNERLSTLRSGGIDLRTALTEPETAAHFEGRAFSDEPKVIHLKVVDDVPEAWLPAEGFLLSNFSVVSADDVVKEAIAKNSAVIVCAMNPPESRGTTPRVDADRLAGYIKAFQMLVRQAAKNVANVTPTPKKKNSVDPFGLNVFAFSGGSFGIHFESKEHANLFGESLIGAAMKQIDDIMQAADLPVDQIADKLTPYKGATLAAYHNLLKFVDKHEAPFTYRWSEPASAVPRGSRITPAAAKAVAAILETETSLTKDPFGFVGHFTSVNTDRAPFAWSARDTKDGRHNGHADDPGVLSGVTIKTRQYALSCEYRLISTPAEEPTQRLYLLSAKPLDQQ